MRTTVFASALTLILSAFALSAQGATGAKPAPVAGNTQTVSGACSQGTLTTGGLTAAPSDKRTAFGCDHAVVTFSGPKREHVLVELGVRGKDGGKIVGFDGTVDDDFGDIVSGKVHRMSVAGGPMSPADDGDCYLQFAARVGRALTQVQCRAIVHHGQNRQEVIITFKKGR